MPLVSIEASRAFQSLAENPLSRWPHRTDEANRIEPIAKPGFTPSFRLEPKEMVFTIGSCFARHVERELEQLGFSIPMRHIRLSDDPTGDRQQIFNNYGAPSIFNELQWALDPCSPFDPDTGLLELTPGKFLDLHLSEIAKAIPRDAAIQRRKRVAKAMGTAARCRILIVTLGLVEVWWDCEAKRHLNVPPPKQFARRHPGRFELHVLSHAEIMNYLDRTVHLLKKFGRPDHRILLTVSPVPLGSTFTGQDVAVANAYSKSVLRAAAEEIVRANDHIDYFPSYESVTLSDRASAWSDDLIHVAPRLVEINVSRMIAAYLGNDADPENVEREAEEALRQRLWTRAHALFQQLLAKDPGSPQARLGAASSKGGLGEIAAALEILNELEKCPAQRPAAIKAKAQIFRLNDCKEEFAAFCDEVQPDGNQSVLQELAETAFHFRMFDRVEGIAKALAKLEINSATGLLWAGRAALERGQADDAVPLLRKASATMRQSPVAALALGRALVATGDIEGAREAFRHALELRPNFDPPKVELQRLELLPSTQLRAS